MHFNKHIIDVSQGINSYEIKDNFTLYSYSNTEYTSDWMNVSDQVEYLVTYECKDLSKFIGIETNPAYEVCYFRVSVLIVVFMLIKLI